MNSTVDKNILRKKNDQLFHVVSMGKFKVTADVLTLMARPITIPDKQQFHALPAVQIKKCLLGTFRCCPNGDE